MKRLLLVLIASFGGVVGIQAQVITSVQDGPWNDPATWDVGVPTSANSTSIVINHIVNVPSGASVTADQISVSAFATLTVDGSGTLTVADDGTGASDLDVYNDGIDYGYLTVNGTLINNNLATITGTDQGNTTFGSGSIYRHLYTNTEGSIPIANWDANSTVQIQGYTLTANLTASAGGNWNQSFGNVVFNCALAASRSVDFAGLLTDVQNDFTVSSTGAATASVRLSTTQNPTIAIGRDLTISGSSRVIFNTTGAGTNLNIGRDFVYNSTNATGSNLNSTGNTTLNIGRNFSMNASGGTLTFASGTGAGNGTLNVSGNFTLTAGTLTETSSSTGVGNINFTGSAVHSYSNSGTISNSINFSVATLSTLDVGTSFIAGGGSFTLNGTLRLGSTDAAGALQANTSAGNIRTPIGTRTYAANSTIIYNGASAQFIGDGFPSSGLVNLTINNSSGVTLSTSLDIVALSVLNLASGNIVIGSQTLTINGTVTGSGGITGGATSNLVIGGTGNFGTLTFSGSNQLNNFTINRTGGSGRVTLGGNLTIVGTFTQTAGVLAIGSNTLTISGAFGPSLPDDLETTSSSTIVIDGSGTLPTDVGLAGTALGTLTLARSGATLATTSNTTITNLNLSAGTFSNGSGMAIASGGTITRSGGTLSTAPTNTTNAFNVVYTSGTISTGPELPTNTTALSNLSKTGSGTLSLSAAVTVNGVLTLSSGTLNAGSNAMDLKGNFVSNAGSTLTSATVTFSGTTTISGSTPPTFGNVTITGTVTPSASYTVNGNLVNNGTLNAGSGTTTFGGTTAITGSSTSSFNNVLITGTLAAPAGSMNVAGSFTNNGTFTHNSGTVVFNGSSTIAGSSGTTFRNITISGTLTSPTTLTLAGNFTNNGTFVRGSGTVVFAGSSTQSISGASVTDFNNITVTNTAGPPAVRVQSNQNLRGVLTLSSNSQFDADGSGNTSVFSLISTADDPTADAAIATLPTGASVTGSVTVQRYMSIETGVSGNGRFYRYISSPVTGAPLSQVQATIPVTGSFTGTSTCSGCGSGQSMFAYDETALGPVSTGYIDFPSTANTETLATGRGYTLFIRGNVAPISSAGSALWSVRAPINSGTVNFPVSFTSSGTLANDGWNLVGNPYPSTIDWNAASGWTKTNLDGTIYMTDNGDNPSVVATWNGVTGTNGGSRYIATGQAFWVKAAAAAPALSANENVKAAGTQTSFFKVGELEDIVRITLRKGSVYDESVIHFRDDATAGFDLHADAYKWKNSTLNVSTLADTMKLAINSLPKLTCGTTIKLNLSEVAAGGYSLDFSEFDSFAPEVSIQLTDLMLNKVIDVRSQASYVFTVTTDAASFGSDRFSVTFAYGAPSTLETNHSQKACVGEGSSVTVLQSDFNSLYSIYRDGVEVVPGVSGNGGTLELLISKESLVTGVNSYELRRTLSACSQLMVSRGLSITVEGLPVVSAANTSRCGAGTITLNASGGEVGQYRWYNSETDLEPLAGVNGASFVTPSLDKTKTYYVSAVNSLGCEGARTPIAAVVHYPLEVQSVVAGATCGTGRVTLAAAGGEEGSYRWYEAANAVTAIAGATGSEFLTPLITESTTYYVSVVNANGCEGTRKAVEASIVNLPAPVISQQENTLVSSYELGNQWYLDGVLIEGATNQEYVPIKSGTYTAEVTLNGCVQKTDYEYLVTGLGEGAARLKVYPNVTTGKISVEVKSTNPARAEVLNAQGRTIVDGWLRPAMNGTQSVDFDLTNSADGFYFVRIVEGARVRSVKIIKK